MTLVLSSLCEPPPFFFHLSISVLWAACVLVSTPPPLSLIFWNFNFWLRFKRMNPANQKSGTFPHDYRCLCVLYKHLAIYERWIDRTRAFRKNVHEYLLYVLLACCFCFRDVATLSSPRGGCEVGESPLRSHRHSWRQQIFLRVATPQKSTELNGRTDYVIYPSRCRHTPLTLLFLNIFFCLRCFN